MTSRGESPQGRDPLVPGLRWAGWFAFLPVLLVTLGAWHQGLFADTPASFVAAMAFLAIAVLALWALVSARPRLRVVVPNLWVAVFLCGVAYYCGFGSIGALVILGLAALAIATLVPSSHELPVSVSLLAGVAILSAIVGWSVPFPMHGSRGYLLLGVGLVVWRWSALAPRLKQGLQDWQATCQEMPAWVLLALASVSVAGLGLWLPSMNYDDNSAHLLLPSQLLHDGYYHLDVQTQIWAVAPWANNVLHGMAALLVGSEARAVLNLIWLLLGVSGAYRLASAVDAPPSAALAAAAVYASLPLTGFFTTSMQVDGASAAVLLHLAALLVMAGRGLPPAALAGLLVGLLAGLKATNAIYALPALGWLAWLAIGNKQASWLLRMTATAVIVGGASYAYAFAVTGNPLFPLFNSVFQSAYYPTTDFFDPRWSEGLSWTMLWDLTVHTDRYGEVYPGAWGVAPLALLPAMLLGAWFDVRLRWVALWFLMAGLVVFAQVPYMRYIFQATAVLAVLGVVALHRFAGPGVFRLAIVMLVAGNALLLPKTSWMAHQDPWHALLTEGRGALQGLEADMAPERVLLKRILDKDDDACILLATPDSPYIGMAAGRAVSVNGTYDLRMSRAFALAQGDGSGGGWKGVLQSVGISYLVTPQQVGPVLERVLDDYGFERIDQQGPVVAWAHPDPSHRACTGTLMHDRDEAHRRLHPGDRH